MKTLIAVALGYQARILGSSCISLASYDKPLKEDLLSGYIELMNERYALEKKSRF